jgi:type IV secretory pathway TrbL component
MAIEDDGTLVWFLLACIAALIMLGLVGWLFG